MCYENFDHLIYCQDYEDFDRCIINKNVLVLIKSITENIWSNYSLLINLKQMGLSNANS